MAWSEPWGGGSPSKWPVSVASTVTESEETWRGGSGVVARIALEEMKVASVSPSRPHLAFSASVGAKLSPVMVTEVSYS